MGGAIWLECPGPSFRPRPPTRPMEIVNDGWTVRFTPSKEQLLALKITTYVE